MVLIFTLHDSISSGKVRIMIEIIGIFTAVILSFLSLLHVYWALGGGRGFAAAIPTADDKPLFWPSPAMTLVVAFLLLVSAGLVLGNLGFWSPGRIKWLFRAGLWGVTAVLTLRAIGDFKYVGFCKKVRHTTFAQNDTRFYSPLCLLLAVGCAAVAMDMP